jgi:hypothetical protein
MLYKVTAAHAPTHDAGVHWASAGIDWPDPAPIVSTRDQHLPPLSEFHSPFRFAEETVRWSLPDSHAGRS